MSFYWIYIYILCVALALVFQLCDHFRYHLFGANKTLMLGDSIAMIFYSLLPVINICVVFVILGKWILHSPILDFVVWRIRR